MFHRLTGIDRRVGLDDVADFPAAARGQPSLQHTDDGARQRLIKPERIADGKGGLPDLQVRGAADHDRLREFAHACHADDCKVVVRSETDDSPL
jgi:hypothetical protein